jgi:hypothetical protein
MSDDRNARCIACGALFPCRPGPDCWCMARPFRPMPEKASGCLCPACFDAAERDAKAVADNPEGRPLRIRS